MKRRVVFSTDQLIMSFGGAIGLFLGASFISIYGLVFVLSEFVFSNCVALVRGEKRKKTSMQQIEKRVEEVGHITTVTVVGQRRY